MGFDLPSYLKERRIEVEKVLAQCLTPCQDSPGAAGTPSVLFQAMHYSLFAGGKRIRPIWALAATEAVGGTVQRTLVAAAALEMIHTYSLIHDDLPAMDNDTFRRGMPTNHTVHGEAMAILAGDGLLTHAFVLLAEESLRESWDPLLTLQVIREMGSAAGPTGMVGGQALDIGWEGKKVDLRILESIHRNKTGALIRAAVRVGGLLGGASPGSLDALSGYGEHVGLAFQIADDILDVEGSQAAMGKGTQKDAAQKKNTYPELMGLEEARIRLNRLIEDAVTSLGSFDGKADPLRAIARFIGEREN